MFKAIVVNQKQFEGAQPTFGEDEVKRVFMVLHGYYGNLFFSKFSTGSSDGCGGDQGIANARRVWAHGLRDFNDETIKTALRACQQRHLEYPPSLPQFIGLCAANQPRMVFSASPRSIGMSGAPRSRFVRDAHAINAGHVARTSVDRYKLQAETDGLNALKHAIADAVRTGGGDEAVELVRLDTFLPSVTSKTP